MTNIVILVASLMAMNGEIPSVYHGYWSTDMTACGGEDTNGVRITASSIDFYEARGVVRSASQGAKGASATIDFTGEGDSWSESVRFRPLDRERLELTALNHTAIYSRCPEQR